MLYSVVSFMEKIVFPSPRAEIDPLCLLRIYLITMPPAQGMFLISQALQSLQHRYFRYMLFAMISLVGVKGAQCFGTGLGSGACRLFGVRAPVFPKKRYVHRGAVPSRRLSMMYTDNVQLDVMKEIMKKQQYGMPFIKKLPPIYGPCHGAPPSFEHVVPRSMIVKSVKGKKKGVLAVNDAHNIFAAPLHINQRRSNAPYTLTRPGITEVWKGSAMVYRSPFTYGYADYLGSGNYIVRYPAQLSLRRGRSINRDILDAPVQFSVNPDYRGVVARAALYMEDKWHVDSGLTIIGGRDEAFKWHRKHPVSLMEIVHNYLGYKIQGNVNPYIWDISNTPAALELLGNIIVHQMNGDIHVPREQPAPVYTSLNGPGFYSHETPSEWSTTAEDSTSSMTGPVCKVVWC